MPGQQDSQPSYADVRLASKGALKTTYYVLIGIAITEALNRVFLSNGRFVGTRLFTGALLPPFLLLLAYLPTLSRFVHGASIHLDVVGTQRLKPLFDFIGFFVQALLFYLMALSVNVTATFIALFAILMLADGVWILVLRFKRFLKLGRMEKEWILSDILLAAVALALVFVPWPVTPMLAAAAICVVAWVAAVIDYGSNTYFYFPQPPLAITASQ